MITKCNAYKKVLIKYSIKINFIFPSLMRQYVGCQHMGMSTCDGWHLFYKVFFKFIQDLHSTGSPAVPLLKAEYTKKRRRRWH